MEPNVYDKIKEVDLDAQMKSSYLDYSMSVIVDRALPDVRDGLKPVQRRVLFALHQLGVTSTSQTKKCATIVGETMGKYHPHGDSSIYGALVNMGQPWNYRKVLIAKQGNFGSEDGDSPAAMRYTEAKMSKMAELMLLDINKDEVDFMPNFSNEYEEPKVLPARFPNLLINGTQGIAVGMATSIPPHNFEEVITAVKKIIDDKISDKETDINEILDIIKGPDFPTGGQIIGKKGIRDYLTTGRGKILVRSICEIENMDKSKQRIVIKELPYQVHRSELIKKIADLVKDKKIEGISNIIDVYGKKTKDKIHIELKKDANANIILNQLYNKTELQTNISIQMLCIVNGEPKTLNVLSMLNEFLKHQFEVVTRRTKFDLKQSKDRAHIVEGLIKAISIIDDIVKLIKESKNTEDAKTNLIKTYNFSEKQAQSIVDMRLKALTNLESEKLKNEYSDLENKIKYFEELLADDKKMYGLIKDELIDITSKEKDERTTEIIQGEAEEFEVEDLIEDGRTVVAFTHLGYIKRMEIDTFKNQNRGGKGIKGMSTINDDFIKEVFTTTLHSNIMFITNKGRLFILRGYQVPEASRTARGINIANLLKLTAGEVIKAIVDCDNMESDKNIVFATKNGIIKKSSLNEFKNVRSNGIKAITIKEDDELVSAKVCSDDNDIFLVTKNGLCNRFSIDKIRTMGRTASGVRGIKIAENDMLISMLVSSEGEDILIVAENGIGKRTAKDEFSAKNRGTKGMICYKPDDKTGHLIGAELVSDTDDIILINESGVIIRIAVEDINRMGRSAKGVRIMKTDSILASMTKVKKEDKEE